MSTRTENLAKNKMQLIRWIGEIDRVVHEIAVSGTASASISAAGGSKNYTRQDLDKLRSVRRDYVDRVAQINRALAGSGPIGIRRVMTVRY